MRINDEENKVSVRYSVLILFARIENHYNIMRKEWLDDLKASGFSLSVFISGRLKFVTGTAWQRHLKGKTSTSWDAAVPGWYFC